MSTQSKLNRPNIIVVLCDQLRPFELSCYGHPVVSTPCIDWLAEHGVKFEQAVTNNPVCTPARSCLLSGQYSRTCVGDLSNTIDESPPYQRNKFPNPTIAEILKKFGYRTCLIGKWHIDAHPGLMGFDYYVYPKVHHLNKNQLYFDPSGRSFIVEGYASDYNKKILTSCLDEYQNSNEPFFIFYNIAMPHMPFFDVPEHYQRYYSPSQVKLRDNVWINGEIAYDERWFKIYIWDYIYYMGYFDKELQLPADFDLRSLTALYYGMVKYVDDQVGEIINTLEKYNHLDDTIIIFTSDHGDNLGSHHLFNKSQLYEESIRIPFIWYYPKLFRPAINQYQIAQIIDVVPTILDLCDIDIPKYIQGQSLAPILLGDKEELSINQAFIETDRYHIGIRTPSHLFGMAINPEQPSIINKDLFLFNLRDDPWQVHNKLLEQDEYKIFKDLRKALVRWHENIPWFKGVKHSI
jgi:choline-sulfatase